MTAREYKVTYNYTVDGGVSESKVIEGYNWNDTPRMPEIKDNYTAGGYRYYIDGWKVGTDNAKKQLEDIKVNGDLVLTATYGAGIGAKYTINFYGKADDGVTDVLLNEGSNIYTHNATVTVPGVPQTIDTATALYTFEGWSPEVNTTATGDADYYATYSKKAYVDVKYYNYDGTLLNEVIGKRDGLLEGAVVPVFDGTPEKAEDVVGTYKFIGWKDGSGNDVVPGTTVLTGDTYLTAQFETVYKNYTVKFVNDNGDVVSKETYHYAEEIVVPANPTKVDDDTYIYSFKGWTPAISEVCYGDATYTATYRRELKTYSVTWLSDADKNNDGKKDVLDTNKYTHNAKIQQYSVNAPVNYPTPEEGKEWAFDYWVQCDADGKDILDDNGQQIRFVRGQRMPAEALYFYPVFKAVNKIVTVTFYEEDGTTKIGEKRVEYGTETFGSVSEGIKATPKYPDETYHYTVEWVFLNDSDIVEEDVVTNNISVKATYIAEEHEEVLVEVLAEPTCNVPGYGSYKCAAETCTLLAEKRMIPPLADDGAPTGTIYVGDSKWTSADYNDKAINYSDVKYVSPNTNIVLTAKDTGSEDTPDMFRGVGKIEYYIAGNAMDDPSSISNWIEGYNYESQKSEVLNAVLKENEMTLVDYDGLIKGTIEQQMKKADIDRAVEMILAEYKANAVGVLSNLDLVDGETYIIYVKLTDRAGNGEVNESYLSSGTISYGSKAAEIAVTGNGTGAKFCTEANVRITDDGADLEILLDGEEVEAYINPGTTSANSTFVASFKVTTDKENTDAVIVKAGTHTVTVTDKNGNKSTKIFEVRGGHSIKQYKIAASCENPGSKYDLCLICGEKLNEEVLPATGHIFKDSYVDKAADCINDGYRTYACDNNCGEKLVLKPTDDNETLAQAGIAAADLAHLNATDKHTYEKVKDEDGEDTDEYVWVIDQAANCVVAGSKHRDCIVCGIDEARIIETIPVDENAHNLSMARVTKKPSCTEEGEKTRKCKRDNCNYVEVVEKVPALGHTAGEYKILEAATCEEAGEKILKCAVCGEYMADAEAIPALGHKWVATGDPFKKGDGNWYQKYECANGCGATDEKVTEYEEKVSAIVTFMNGDATVGTVTQYVGETIIATDVTVPTKEADATYTYTFSHWADAEGKEVKFPIEVKKGGATYYAVFAEKYINYTITYYNATVNSEGGVNYEEYKKTGYLHNGTDVSLAKGPSKAEDWQYTYKFAGWQVYRGETVYTDKVTIDGANINLVATYEPVKKTYAVTFAYSKSNIIETFSVDAGEEAKCEFGDDEITKNYDSKYHYEFDGWDKAEQLKAVKSYIYTTPKFKAVEHVYEETLAQEATCDANKIYTKKCKVCGHSYQVENTNSALGHYWGDPVFDEETGKTTIKCQRVDCGETQVDTRSYTVKFFLNDADTKAIKTISYIPWGTTIEAIKLPATPMKEADETNTYKFVGWALKGTTDVVDVTKIEVKADAEYVAIFEATTREYTVTFAYDAHNVIMTVTGVKAGESVAYTGETPTKKFDDDYHYTFSGWSGSTENIYNNVYVTAKFSRTAHDNTPTITGATCTTGEGRVYSCACGYKSSVVTTSKPLGHDYKEVTGTRVEPKDGKDGSVTMKCSRPACGHTYVKVLPWNGGAAAPSTVTIRITVKDQNGNGVSGAKVALYQDSKWVAQDVTNADGIVAFEVAPGKYTAVFTGVNYAGDEQTEITVDSKGNVSGKIPTMKISDCGCACHKEGFIGKIFRFFHKIIQKLTGSFKCCKCPSEYYYK